MTTTYSSMQVDEPGAALLLIEKETPEPGAGHVRVPALLSHHYRDIDPQTGSLMGAISDQQAQRVRQLVTDAGQRFEYLSFSDMAHSMHAQDPEMFTRTVVDFSSTLGQES